MLKFLCLQEEEKKIDRKKLGHNVDWKVRSITPAQVIHKLSKFCLLDICILLSLRLLDIYILLSASGTGKFWFMLYPGT